MIVIKTREKFALYPAMSWEDRFKICKTVANWLTRRYSLDYADTLNDCVAAILDEERLVAAAPGLIDPASPKEAYWRAVKAAVERQRRPARKYFKGSRKKITTIAIKDDLEDEAYRRAAELRDLKEVVNVVLRHVDPNQYKIITQILSAALNNEGAKPRRNTVAIKQQLVEDLAAEFDLSATRVRQLFNDFIIKCRNENGL